MPGPRLATRSTSRLPHFGHNLGGETKADRNSGSHHPPADWIRRATSNSSQPLTVVARVTSEGPEKDPAQEPTGDEHQTERKQEHQRTFEDCHSPSGKNEDRNQEEDQPQEVFNWIWGTSRHDWEAEDACPENPWRPFFVQCNQDGRSFTLPRPDRSRRREEAVEGVPSLKCEETSLKPESCLVTSSATNGVATSSSPFQSLSHGDEDIATPESFPKGALSICAEPRPAFLVGSLCLPCDGVISHARFAQDAKTQSSEEGSFRSP